MKTSPGNVHPFVLVVLSSGVSLAACSAIDFSRNDSSGIASQNSSPDAGSFPGPSTDPTEEIDASGTFSNDAAPGCAPEAPIPTFGAPVTCSVPPPPISGGTLLITRDGSQAVAADPDRDVVYVVDLASRTLKFTVALKAGDEPGRLAEDGSGRIHVALRRSGVLATLDPKTGAVLSRRAACPAPRGVAWQASTDVVWVACATGELASLPAAGGAATIQRIQRDLRDIVLNGDSLSVTQFRSAQVLRLASDDKTIARTDPVAHLSPSLLPQVLWRAVPGPSGAIVAVHQAESTQSLSTMMSGGYGCSGLGGNGLPVAPPPLPLPSSVDEAGSLVDASSSGPAFIEDALTSVVTVLGSDGTVASSQIFRGVLPVDVAISADGAFVVAVAAGGGSGPASINDLFVFGQQSGLATSLSVGSGPATAVAIDSNNNVLVQTREPAALFIVPALSSTSGPAATVSLSAISRADTGHEIFHTHAGSLIACASCHPEGGDDGHVWILDGNARRTPSLRGTIAGTAPYHWPGDEKDFPAIVNDVYKVRMNGGTLTTAQVGALTAFVEGIPAPPAPTWVDPSAAEAGRAIFQRADVGCASCHSGPKFTNNATLDVGTGGKFQVPPLVGVGWRTPLMHGGCAATIADRFGSCATEGHGNIATLSTTDVANLTAYLETL